MSHACSARCGWCGACSSWEDRGDADELNRIPPKCRHLQDRAFGYRWCEACGLELNPPQVKAALPRKPESAA